MENDRYNYNDYQKKSGGGSGCESDERYCNPFGRK